MTDTAIGEADLIAAIKAGDRDAFANLYETHVDRVYRYLRGLVGDPNDAEDLTADVFLRVTERIGRYNPRGIPVISWLLRIAHNLAMDVFKRRSRRGETELFENAAVTGDPADEAIINIRVAEVTEAMNGLTALQRQVISLRFGAALSTVEAAAAMNRTPEAVRFLQYSALRALRRSLEADDGEDDD